MPGLPPEDGEVGFVEVAKWAAIDVIPSATTTWGMLEDYKLELQARGTNNTRSLGLLTADRNHKCLKGHSASNSIMKAFCIRLALRSPEAAG